MWAEEGTVETKARQAACLLPGTRIPPNCQGPGISDGPNGPEQPLTHLVLLLYNHESDSYSQFRL